MQGSRSFPVSAVLATALLLAGCGILSSPPTVAVQNDQCGYSGPVQVPEHLSLRWDIETRTSTEAFTFILATLGPGRTKADIQALRGIDILAPQPWLKPIHYTTLLAGRSTEQIDLGPTVVDRLDPIYIVCVGVKGIIGVLGPIEVNPGSSSGSAPSS